MNDTALKSHQLYINRELSFLEFNWRVLAQGQDDSLPLLERVKFLAISCSNLDEFFEIRVSGLKQRKELGSRAGGPDGMDVDNQLAAIHRAATHLVEAQYALLNDELLPTLRRENIRILRSSEWSPAQHAWAEAYFRRE